MSPLRRFLTPAGAALVAVLLLVQTGISHGEPRRFNPHRELPPFDLPGLDGERHSLDDFKGRPVLLSVWASWCVPCRYELPEYQRARDALSARHNNAAFLTVNVGESGARAKAWMDKHELDLPVLLASHQFMRTYGIMALPSILVFDSEGNLAVLHEGWVMGTDLVDELAKDLESLGKKAHN